MRYILGGFLAGRMERKVTREVRETFKTRTGVREIDKWKIKIRVKSGTFGRFSPVQYSLVAKITKRLTFRSFYLILLASI